MKKGKRTLALLLVFTLVCPLFSTARAAASDRPTPPEWCLADEYYVFEDSVAYGPEWWDRILRLRADAAADHPLPERLRSPSLTADWNRLTDAVRRSEGTPDPGLVFEYVLLKGRYACNTGARLAWVPAFSELLQSLDKDSEAYRILDLWYLRTTTPGKSWASDVDRLLSSSHFTLKQFWNNELFCAYTESDQQKGLDALAELGRNTSGLAPHPYFTEKFHFERTGTPVTPTPPAWCPEDEYAVIDGSLAYLPGNWARLQRVRDYLEHGEGFTAPEWTDGVYWDYFYLEELRRATSDRGLRFEFVLLDAKFYALRGTWTGGFGEGIGALVEDERLSDDARYICRLWDARIQMLPGSVDAERMKYITKLLSDPRYTTDSFLDCVLFTAMPQERRDRLKGTVFVLLDGARVHPGYYGLEWQTCRVIGGRTMVPLRSLAEKLGSEVAWEAKTRTITITRGSDVIVMAVGKQEATLNGETVTMDVAPVMTGGRTYIPVRYMAEFFGQKVDWDAKKHTVMITDDPARQAGGSNLSDWALPMGAMLNYLNDDLDPVYFGGGRLGNQSTLQSMLQRGWNIDNREELISTVASMTFSGHNSSFLYDAALVNSLSPAEYQSLLSQAEGVDAYMWPYTKQLSQKWGSRGILAWDLFRMSNLVQWGYTAGYLTYPEALALLEPAATLLQHYFSSWDEAYENYLDGYHWWARSNVLDQDVWETPRGQCYQEMKRSTATAGLFRDELFREEILPVPGITFQELVQSLPGSSD